MQNNNELRKQYLGSLSQSRSRHTIATYTNALLCFTKAVGEGAPLTQETYQDFLTATKDSPGTQVTYRVAVAGLYRYAAFTYPGQGDISWLKIINGMQARKKPERLPNYDREAIEQVIEYCAALSGDLLALRDRAFVLVLADTGLRISEACGLDRGAIDWREAVALVIGKGDRQTFAHFSRRSIDALQDYLNAREDGKLGKALTSLPLFMQHGKKGGEYVRGGKGGKRIHSSGMWHAIKDRMTEAGIDHHRARIHDFRHHFISTIQLATGDLKLSQELARHKNISTTSRYAHLGSKAGKVYDEIFNK